MNSVIVLLAALCVLVGGFAVAEEAGAPKVLRHVVMFKFKEGTTPEQIKAIEDGFRALPGQIPTIKDFEWGTDLRDGKGCQGFTHLFLVTFENKEGLDVYSPHPAHQAFVALLKPHMDKVMVIDYMASR